jgi:glycosyltransferase involved in cell wall biosynthesis
VKPTELTALVLTFNEAPNLRRTLEKLCWLHEVVVLDSFSTDETLAIARSFPQVRVVQRAFDTFAAQCNFGLQQVRTEWVLSLDADYVLTDDLVSELKSLQPPEQVAGYTAGFDYCVWGHVLRACLYPPRTVLYRRSRAAYENDGHAHRVRVAGELADLHGRIQHDDRKPLSRWLWAQARYTDHEVAKLAAAKPADLSLPDRLRKLVFIAPPLVLFYTLFARGVILDGWPGLYYAFQRVVAEMILSLKLLEAKFTRHPGGSP